MIFGQLQMFWSYQAKEGQASNFGARARRGTVANAEIGAIWIATFTRSLLIVNRDGFMANVPCALSFHSVHDTM